MITIGLVGCGNWGKNILRDLISMGCRVLVASHGVPSRELALEMRAHAVFVDSTELPECDGYILATPIDSLAGEVIKLLPRGRPIFSEKTLCPTLDTANELEVAGAQDKVFLMHKWEYHKGVQMLRHIFLSGRIGELEQIHCRRHGWVRPGIIPDALILLATHDLTIARHILGTIPEPSYALIRWQDAVPISLMAVLGDTPPVILSVEARHPEYSRSVTLFGSEGAAHLPNSFSDHIVVSDKSGEEKVSFKSNMPLLDELQEFIAYLRDGPEPRCGFEHARLVAKTLDALRQIAVKNE